MEIYNMTSRNGTHLTYELFNKDLQNLGNESCVILSPISVIVLLSAFISSGGPKCDTADQICKVIRGPETQCSEKVLTQIHNDILKYKNSYSNLVKISNAAFISTKLNVKSSFRKQFCLSSSDLVKKINFTNVIKSKKNINNWIKNAINKKIKVKYDKKFPLKNTTMILLNAINFEAKWEDTFSTSDTEDEEFDVSSSENLKIPSMFYVGPILYNKYENGFHVIAKNFSDTRFKFIVILPTVRHNLQVVDQMMSKGFDWRSFVPKTLSKKVFVQMPRFRVNAIVDITQVLQSHGINDLFGEKANLSGVSSDKLFVNYIKQVFLLDVRETGLASFAKTPDQMSDRSAVTATFMVDQPFYFAVYDTKIELPLIFGKVNKPEVLKK